MTLYLTLSMTLQLRAKVSSVNVSWTTQPGPGRAGLSRALRRYCSRARPSLSSGEGVGPADGPVRLSPPTRVPGSQDCSGFRRTTRKANHFAWPRDTTRDLRRRRAIHAPWMRRPGLDRRRSIKGRASNVCVDLRLRSVEYLDGSTVRNQARRLAESLACP